MWHMHHHKVFYDLGNEPIHILIVMTWCQKCTGHNLQTTQKLILPGNVAKNWHCFEQRFSFYLTTSGMDETAPKGQTSLLLHVMGDQRLDVYSTLTFYREEDKDNIIINAVINKFWEYCNPYKNMKIKRRSCLLHKNQKLVRQLISTSQTR